MVSLCSGCGSSAVCGEGFAAADGTCRPFCTEECGDHQTCKVTGDTASCECVAGYEGNPCKWGGGLTDSEFAQPDAWSAVNGATISPLVDTSLGQGAASFIRGANCDAGAISQTVSMPRYQDAEPFVVNMWYQAIGGPSLEVGYGRAVKRPIQRALGWNFGRFCLGEAAYGEANVGEEGWHFYQESRPFKGNQVFSLEPGVGESGSSGARLYKPAGVEKRAGMYTQVSSLYRARQIRLPPSDSGGRPPPSFS